MKKNETQELATSLSQAMDEDVLNNDEMGAAEGGGSGVVDNALANCSTNNCRAGNCSSGCSSSQDSIQSVR